MLSKIGMYAFCLLVCSSVFSGAVLTKKGDIFVGEIVDDGENIKVKIQYGTTTVRNIDIKWIVRHPKIKTYYLAGRYAHSKEQYDVALKFYKESVKREAATKTKAKVYAARLERLVNELRASRIIQTAVRE